MRAFVVLFLCACLTAQDRPAPSPAGLQLRIVESSGPAHAAGSRSSSALTVLVLDKNGAPAPGATVSFQLPASGAGGVFSNASATDIILTGDDGRAAASSATWSKTPGAFEIRVTASKGPARVSAAYPHRVLASMADSPMGVAAGRSRRKLLLILAGVAAGSVTAALAISRSASSASPTAPAGGPTVSVSIPVITIGAP